MRQRRAASSRSSASWRSPMTRWVSSVLAQMMPPTVPSSFGNRAVGKGVVGLFGVAVALHDEELRFDVGSLVAAHGGVEHRPDIAPDFAPDLGGRPPERPRVFPADDRLVGIVVEVDQFTPQPIQIGWREVSMIRIAMRRFCGQVCGRSQRGRHPVEFTDELTEFSAARKEPNIVNFLLFLGVLSQMNPCTAVIGRRSITGVMIIPRKS